MHGGGVDILPNFFTLPEGAFNGPFQPITPALNGPGKVGTENSINGGSKGLKDGKNGVSHIRKQADNGTDWIIEHICKEVGKGSNEVPQNSEHINSKVDQGNKQVSDESHGNHEQAGNGSKNGMGLRSPNIQRPDNRHDCHDQGQHTGHNPKHRTSH